MIRLGLKHLRLKLEDTVIMHARASCTMTAWEAKRQSDTGFMWDAHEKIVDADLHKFKIRKLHHHEVVDPC